MMYLILNCTFKEPFIYIAGNVDVAKVTVVVQYVVAVEFVLMKSWITQT